MKLSKFKKIVIVFVVFLLLQIGLGGVIIYKVFIDQTRSSLQALIERVQRDIKYDNGTWDLTEYNANPLIPGRFRLYVFSSDGFVIDRWRPISGFMDLSDFKRLMEHNVPETVETSTNQRWRVFSLPINNSSDSPIGVIHVAYYNPDDMNSDSIDIRLKAAADQILNNISFEDGQIDTRKITRRSIPYDISFQVVDQYNHILIYNSNVNSMTNLPTFIDPSYVRREMQEKPSRQIKGTNGNNSFLVETAKIVDSNNEPVGVIIAASTLSTPHTVVKTYALIGGAIGLLLTTLFTLSIYRILNRKELTPSKQLLSEDAIISMSFTKERCLLTINDESIEIVYATNQFYMLDALFSKPKKKWETDELLEKFGEDFQKNGWRKVYDAMLSINRKTGSIIAPKLIVTNNKTYQVNPLLIDKIK